MIILHDDATVQPRKRWTPGIAGLFHDTAELAIRKPEDSIAARLRALTFEPVGTLLLRMVRLLDQELTAEAFRLLPTDALRAQYRAEDGGGYKLAARSRLIASAQHVPPIHQLSLPVSAAQQRDRNQHREAQGVIHYNLGEFTPKGLEMPLGRYGIFWVNPTAHELFFTDNRNLRIAVEVDVVDEYPAEEQIEQTIVPGHPGSVFPGRRIKPTGDPKKDIGSVAETLAESAAALQVIAGQLDT